MSYIPRDPHGALASDARPIVVTGATRQQGGHLLDRGDGVVAVTRDGAQPAARALAARGARVVAADLGAGAGLAAALTGARAAFLVTSPFERGADFEVTQTERFVEAARDVARRGEPLERVVLSSVWASMTSSPIAPVRSKGDAEVRIRDAGLPLTIVGAPPFFEAWRGLLDGGARGEA